MSLYVLGGTVSTILVTFFVVLWIYCILWVAKDISWRTDHFGLQLASILLIVFFTPILGRPVYMLIRPIQVESEIYEQDVYVRCFSCRGHNDKEFSYCVYCGETLKIACPTCEHPVGIDYVFCAWCGNNISDDKISS